MRAGNLDRKVTLQQRTLAAANARGEKIASYSTLAEVWGERRDVSGREFFAAGQLHAEASTRFLIRYRSSLTTVHRVVCEGVTYDVVHIAEVGRRVGIELVCKVVT
jgi:SPP1 family predicted phage head-tail adaptor